MTRFGHKLNYVINTFVKRTPVWFGFKVDIEFYPGKLDQSLQSYKNKGYHAIRLSTPLIVRDNLHVRTIFELYNRFLHNFIGPLSMTVNKKKKKKKKKKWNFLLTLLGYSISVRFVLYCFITSFCGVVVTGRGLKNGYFLGIYFLLGTPLQTLCVVSRIGNHIGH